MTKIKFLAVAFAILTIFSCSKEDTTENMTSAGSKASITVKIKGSAESMSKATGDPGDATDVAVNDYIIFLFDAGGKLVGTPKYMNSAADGVVNDANTTASKIYVVANTGVIDGGPFAGITDENDLKTRTGKLIDETGASTQTSDHLWMSGVSLVGPFTPGLSSGDPSTASVSVNLAFVAARIDVVVMDKRRNNTPGVGSVSIADNSVALLFAGADGKFFAESAEKVTQSNFFSGIATATTTGVAQADVLNDTVEQPFATSGEVEYHFYTFGYNGDHDFGGGLIRPTILTIASTRTNADGTEDLIYYPVHFNASDAGMTIEPGKKYTVTLTLTGNVNNGGGSGGTTPPEDLPKSAEITITVNAATWEAKIINKEFN
ncbi:hypothetical protein HMPREF1212_02964 [Parabacteroides sp. HGS0025]|uniref:fimbrial protein n=1 Tax=Parabacteroides sp. HGS0025 TaxID=1078087 RepID=UPI00061757E1|nr:fimbrial protein [Parabacteroides sp. HGS0025]KKB49805.1 hypothetical protein HMPREF1212_02964 [Parabacteroides sp. HGS0025]